MGALNNHIEPSKAKGFKSRVTKDGRARSLFGKDEFKSAVVLFRENLAWSLENLGEEHDATVYDQEILASTLNELQQYEEAKNLNKKSLDTRLRVNGVSPPSK
jgi:hypothetical protein